MPTNHKVSKLVFEKIYLIVISKREECSANGQESSGSIDLIIFAGWSVMGDKSRVFSENPSVKLA